MCTNKKLFTLLLLSLCITASHAGYFEWSISNLSPETFTTVELKEIIRQGIGNTSADLPNLPKPWYLNFDIGLNNNATDYRVGPGLIVVRKSRNTPSGKQEVACTAYAYGTYTRSDFFALLRERAAFNAKYAVESEDCVVNEPAPASKKGGNKFSPPLISTLARS